MKINVTNGIYSQSVHENFIYDILNYGSYCEMKNNVLVALYFFVKKCTFIFVSNGS